MKFLCDVHISHKIVVHLISLGYTAVHINDILNGSETKDRDICIYADKMDFIVLTKDSDFRDSYFLKRSPKKIIKINLGNISNQELKSILSASIETIKEVSVLENFLVEIDKDGLYLMGDDRNENK